jgi:hypothetical protein
LHPADVMTSIVNRSATMMLLAACSLTACERGDAGPEPELQPAAVIEAPEVTGGVDTIYTGAPGRDALPAARIYYNLTDHDWYARGDPLVHDNIPFAPAGNPVSAGVDEMEHVGDYLGVDYYVRATDTTTALYVPVFEGYWLPFRPDTAARRAR